MVQDYDKSDLQLMVSPFGDANPIDVGHVSSDGTIHFDWPEVDVTGLEGVETYMEPIARAIGMRFCNDKEIKSNDEAAKAVAVKSISLVKYGKRVGALLPATHKALSNNESLNRHSSLILGSSITWLYSDRDANFEAVCGVNIESGNNYKFTEVTTYSLQLQKGWNIVQNELLDKEDWKNGEAHGSLPKTKAVASVATIPSAIKWYMNYWANDALMELERKLLTQTPAGSKAYEDWLPSALGNLTRVSHAINQKLEGMANESNVQAVFSGGGSKLDLTIADSSGSKDAVGTFLMTQDMTGTEWKDEKDSGYRASTKMGGVPVLVQFDSATNHTSITYNAEDRFIVKALAENMDPETLWEVLAGLALEQLSWSS